MKIRNAIVGASLWVVATGVWALSLGGSRGAVVLGAPLDLSFDVQPDPGTDIASACVTARIMAGETAIGDGRVRVTPLPDMRGRPPAVRVQAAIAVDEPVVTVTLSAVPPQALAQWLGQVRDASRVTVQQTRLNRAPAGWDGSIVLQLPPE